MKQLSSCLTIFLMGLSLTSCANLSQPGRADVNVLKAKVANLEARMQQTQTDDTTIGDVIAGEQKRGEYLQQQIFELSNRMDNLEGKPTESRSSSGSAVSSSGKFISDKMSSPPSVKEVQLALRNAGYYDGAIDGIPGSGSRQAVKKFQKNQGLTVDGVVGAQSWRRLKKYL